MRLTRKTLRKMILREMADMGGQLSQKVVKLAISDAFYLRHPELQGGEIVVDEMDEVAGALVALKGMGFTHVHSLESGDTDSIDSQIQYFDDEIGGGLGRYKAHYEEPVRGAPVVDIDDDDYFI